jgi:hypothetical protein
MTVNWTLNIWDTALIGTATLIGPILAVQAQKWLERHRVTKERRMQIFRILMATRAVNLSAGHVEALNAIPIEFYGPSNSKLKTITDDWQSYLDHLNSHQTNADLWAQKRVELLSTMLLGMSRYLGLALNRSEIEKVYYPTGHNQIESDMTVIRRGIAQVLSGETSIPMAVREFPVSDDAVSAQTELFKQLTIWLKKN